MAEGARITIDAQLQFRHDVEANWLAADPILKVGEPAYTIGYSDRFKLGDGQSKWSELPYLQLGEGGGGGGSQAYESLAWSAIKTLTSGDASVLAQAYAVKQAYNELKSLIPNLADYYTKEQINALIPSLEGYATEAWVLGKGYATENFVNTKIADLINGAPTTLDTLKEIADAFAQSQDVIEALDEAIGKKANQSDLAALAARVAANEGNITSLSSNKLDKSIWDSVFEIDAKGNLRAKVGIYSTSFISARTSDPSAGGGSGGGGAFSLYTWDQVKAMTAEVGGVAPTAYALKQAYNELINATPTLSWNNIQDKPIFATVATSGSYSDLIGRPTALSDLANDVGYITSAAIPTTYAWSAITGKPSFAAVATSGSYNDLSNKPTIPSIAGLASESWVTSNFLGLSGGTISGNLDITGYLKIKSHYFFVRDNDNADWLVTDKNWQHEYTLIHSGNISSQSVNYATSAGQLGGYDITSVFPQILQSYRYIGVGTDLNTLTHTNAGWWNSRDNTDYANAPKQNFGLLSARINSSYFAQLLFGYSSSNLMYRSQYYNGGSVAWSDWRTIAFTDSNVASATKLQTARTIWGQSFDGTANVSGDINLNTSKLFWRSDATHYYIGTSFTNTSDGPNIDYVGYSGHRFVCRSDIEAMRITHNGNVGIGTTSPSEKLSVAGNITASGTIYSAVGLYTPGYLSARSTAGASDRNLKTNIAPVRNALSYILGTKYVSFDWKDTGGHSVGIIAQDELNREWSCLVQKYSEHYSYQYTQHTALLGSALQEEDKKVEALRAEVATLKAEVQLLRQKFND